ncbi:heme/hemin ABC transporter substrate-binding protein [Nocardioides acrostichi]|uniref:heme/hemin ABC transporter substrate-binding protein n=1 Tax=Nocardioides acrostichi TaxID=2784339 RepID=UPI002E2C03CC|nr:ABC transporter substrate-binding protein [Nocardioides acrostichi]
MAGAVSGCGLALGGTSRPGDAAPASSRVAPPLAQTTPLDDPRAWDGVAEAVIDAQVDPVSSDAVPRLPVTVTDAQGTEVTVTSADRILALDVYGTLARTVYDLGLGDRLVGRDVSTQFSPADQLPLVTQNGHDLAAEAILALDPTVILTDTSLGPWDVVLQLRDAGIPVVVLDSHRSLDDVAALTRSTAAALGVPEQGRELARRTQTRIDQAEQAIGRVAPASEADRLRTVFLYVRGDAGVYYLFGEESGADDLIDALGLYDVAEEIGWNGMKPVTDEAIVAAQPDLVVMMTKGLASAGGVEGLLERLPALANTPAGEHERFVTMADSQILGFGPDSAAVLNALAVAVYSPEALR